jgi:hypothetical protein
LHVISPTLTIDTVPAWNARILYKRGLYTHVVESHGKTGLHTPETAPQGLR